MADPLPAISLPGYEFIELFNETSSPVNLQSWSIQTSQGQCILPSFILAPGACVIVSSQAAAPSFDRYGPALYCSGFPALNNDGKRLWLVDSSGQCHDLVEYSSSWYGDSYKQNGGWSLERKSPTFACPSASNWTASSTPSGGTPGSPNSALQELSDTAQPRILRLFHVTDSSLSIEFSTPMDSTTIFNTNNYSFSHGILHPLAIKSSFPEYNRATLLTGVALDSQTVYSITFNHSLMSCTGQPLQSQKKRFARPRTTTPKDIIINELLFDARGDESEFVELFNRANKIIDLAQLVLTNKDIRTGEISLSIPLSAYSTLIFPGDHIVLTRSEASVRNCYSVPASARIIEIERMPSLPDGEGFLCMTNTGGIVIDELRYSSSMHFELLESPDGVSIERINPRLPSHLASSWHSAASVAGFATPGYHNSQYASDSALSSAFSLRSPTFSPGNDGIDDVLLIDYAFQEPGLVASIRIIGIDGHKVRDLAINQTLETSGSFVWDGTDLRGNRLPTGIYIVHCLWFGSKHPTSSSKLCSTLISQ